MYILYDHIRFPGKGNLTENKMPGIQNHGNNTYLNHRNNTYSSGEYGTNTSGVIFVHTFDSARCNKIHVCDGLRK